MSRTRTVSIGKTVEVDVDVEIELTREELIDALAEMDHEEEVDRDVANLISELELEMIAADNVQVRGALKWARDRVVEHLT